MSVKSLVCLAWREMLCENVFNTYEGRGKSLNTYQPAQLATAFLFLPARIAQLVEHST